MKSLETNLASPLLELDLDEQNEANQGYDHEESQEDAHVKVFRGLLWKKGEAKEEQRHLSNNPNIQAQRDAVCPGNICIFLLLSLTVEDV